MRLHNKIALVTGGSRGIGRAIALAFAAEGARVALNYSASADAAANHPGAAEETRQAIVSMQRDCLLLDADIGDERTARQMVRQATAHFGGLDILVCNAGICPMHAFLDMPIELLDRVHAVNLRGHFVCCQEVARVLIDQGRGGRIIAVTSITGTRAGPLQTHYAPTKSGLNSLMQCLAAVLGPHRITCNSVGPGEVDTEMTRGIPDHQEVWDHLSRVLPLHRIGRPEDLAGPVVFLASDEAAYITGQQIMVDGGASVLEA